MHAQGILCTAEIWPRTLGSCCMEHGSPNSPCLVWHLYVTVPKWVTLMSLINPANTVLVGFKHTAGMIWRYVSSGNIFPCAPESSLKLTSVCPTRVSDTQSPLCTRQRFSMCTAPTNRSSSESVSKARIPKSTFCLVSPNFLAFWKTTKYPQPWHC